MKKLEQILSEMPSVKIGLDDFYGKQTVLKAMKEHASQQPDNTRSIFEKGMKYAIELSKETGQELKTDTCTMIAGDYTRHVMHYLMSTGAFDVSVSLTDSDIADEYLDKNIEEARINHHKAADLYRKYVGSAETFEERKRRINRFRSGG